jgi:putative protease
MAEEKLVGKIIHYYGKLGVVIIELSETLEVGKTIHIKGAHDDFTQEVKELQYEHQAITAGKAGQQVGLKVDQKIHENDEVYLAE